MKYQLRHKIIPTNYDYENCVNNGSLNKMRMSHKHLRKKCHLNFYWNACENCSELKRTNLNVVTTFSNNGN